MAFHLHLINAPWDHASAVTPRLRLNAQAFAPAEPHLALKWELGEDGRLQSRWILAQ